MSTVSPVDGGLSAEGSSSEYLVKNKYAAADKLTINGGSNGGMRRESELTFRTNPPLQACLWLRVLTVPLRELLAPPSLKSGF